jgi:gluconate kinase
VDRLGKLKALEGRLYSAMEEAKMNTLPALARQYRETIREIEEIEGAETDGDEIAEILSGREADGKPGAVR